MSRRWATAAIGTLILVLSPVGLAQEPATQPTTHPVTQPAAVDEDLTTRLPDFSIQPGPLRLNFRDATIRAVLEYLSEAAGLIIVDQVSVEGRVTVISHQQIDTDEAIALLNTVLKDKGYTAVRTGRTLKILTLEQARTSAIPVFLGNDPANIEPTDVLITQVIPLRFADAEKLKTDLATLKPAYADQASNAASNALIFTATQADVRRMVEIISAIDGQKGAAPEVAVFQLQYADAATTAKFITDLFAQEEPQQQMSRRDQVRAFFRGMRGGGGGDSQDAAAMGRQAKVIASADAQTNTLVVSGPPDLMDIISQLVKELDSDPSAEQLVFLYHLKNAQADKLMTVLNDIFDDAAQTTAARGRNGRNQRSRNAANRPQDATSLVGQVHVVADQDSNSLLVRTANKHFEAVKAIIADLDRPVPQVLIKVLIAEVAHTDSLDLGVEFSILNLRVDALAEITTDLGGTTEQSGGLITTTIDAGLSATINALEIAGTLDVLSRPYILTSDNQEATIIVGQEVPFIRNTRTTDTGQTINTIEYEDIGIILHVTPHINPEGLVILDVAPEISSISDSTVPISETVNATVFNKRSAQTRVAIRDGQTIVIGGLMEDRLVDTVQKVPFLGDLPLIGGMFRRIVKTKVKTELLIFLTPHVARHPDRLKRISDAQESEVEILEGAIGQSAYDKHLRGMRRGVDDQPAGTDDAPLP